MSPTRQIYLLDPKQLSPETIAVTFAKTSRSPQSFREIADELSEEKSADFNEKWVVGYGHSSIAEHAVLHLAVENISRLAVECMESNRLASYTEKSSRYQIWGLDHFHLPAEFAASPLEALFLNTCRLLFERYQAALAVLQQYLQEHNPPLAEESPAAYKNRLRTCCADVCRYYLPACSLANVGMTINARALEHAVCKMLSHPLEEVQLIGAEIKKVAQHNVPTLVKYAARDEQHIHALDFFAQMSRRISHSDPPEQGQDWLRVIHFDPHAEHRVLAALMLRCGAMSFEQADAVLSAMSAQELHACAQALLGGLGEHGVPLRELEYAALDVEVVLDQGAYFELKRHRMMTQTAQPFGAHLGFATPKLIAQAGLLDDFIDAMQSVQRAHAQLCESDPQAAAYILPNAFNRRVLLHMNLRSALHFIKLRSAPNAHFAIRRAALRLAAELQARFPLFAEYFRPPTTETWQGISANFFESLQ